MPKTALTQELEYAIWKRYKKMGRFACFDVTIGIWGTERVDFMTYENNTTFRCFEIVTTVKQFRASKHTFVGNYNYFVMPAELYEVVKDEIAEVVGVYTVSNQAAVSVKPAKRIDLSVDIDVLKDSMIRSLSRCHDKAFRSENSLATEQLQRRLNKAEEDVEKYRRMNAEARAEIAELKRAQRKAPQGLTL